jgi:hypothetical protein
LVLQRVSPRKPDEGGRVVLAGEIDRTGGLVDVIHFIHGNNWSGQLTVMSREVRKALYFRRGDIHTAASNVPEDRLGAILYRYGMVSEAQLEEALKAQAGQAAKLGQALVEKGLLTPHHLYTSMRRQVEEIFFSVLVFRDGDFYFTRTTDDAGPQSQLQLSAKGLLFEGVKRIDELSLFREQLPSPDLVLVRREPAPPEKLGELEQRVLNLVDGTRNLAAVSQQSHLGEFETTRILYQLLRSGWLQKRPARTQLEMKATAAATSETDTFARIIETFNDVYARIHAAVAQKSKEQALQKGLESFFGSVAEFAPLFTGLTMTPEGQLPVGQVLSSLAFAPTEDKLDYLHRGLNELLFFELFTAGEAVDRREEIELHHRLNEILRDIPPTGEGLEPEISIEGT